MTIHLTRARCTRALAATAAAATLAMTAGCATRTPEPATEPPPRMSAAPTPTLLEARRQKSNPAVNYLTYQHMDQLFSVSRVPASKAAAPLPAGKPWSAEGFRFVHKGQEMSFDEFLERHRANAIIVMRDGKVVKEAYRNGSSAGTRFIGYSMSKSVISMLIGVAIKEGLIGDVDDLVVRYLPELRDTGYAGVTIRNLLMMRTGTDWKEIYTPGSELDRHRDLSLNEAKVYYEDYAFKAKADLPPGTRFNYSTLDTDIAGWLLERAVGQPLSAYMAARLWQPAAMEFSAYWVEQGKAEAPRPFYGAGMAASLRDWARLGQIALDEGRAQDRQLVPAAWMKQATSRLNDMPGYGYYWWSIGDKGFGALGINGQAIYVQPATRTVIALVSYWAAASDPAMSETQRAFFEAVAAALPAN